MAGLRDLKRRIKGIQNMRKITRAMQMVSAAKMRKSQNAVVASRTYSSLAWELIVNVSSRIISSNPLLTAYPKANKVGVILVGTNGGLVGSLNSNLGKILETVLHTPSLPASVAAVTTRADSTEIISEVIVYGKKAKAVAQRMRKTIMADFVKDDKTITTQSIYPLAKYITDVYLTGKYSKIFIVYNRFVSTLVQKPIAKQLLPFPTLRESEVKTASSSVDYLFEPTPAEVLEHLLPRIIESQIYSAILESNASEHSARMVMMKNATEAAEDLIGDLTLTYNQLRQGKITTELAEITAGRIALE